jgi:hypothetical protein
MKGGISGNAAYFCFVCRSFTVCFRLVVVFLLGTVFFVLSVSCAWFCIVLRKLYLLYRVVVLLLCCGVTLDLPVRFVSATHGYIFCVMGRVCRKLVMASFLLVVGSVCCGCVCEMYSWCFCFYLCSHEVSQLCYLRFCAYGLSQVHT